MSKETGSSFDRYRLLYQGALGFLVVASLIGLSVSLTAHVATLCGIDPGQRLKNFWLFQLLLFALLVPVVVELFAKRNPNDILRSPRWMRLVLYSLLVYYGTNFYFFLYWSVNNLSSRATWRMFSAGWIVLFSVAAVYYHVRFRESR